MWKIIIATFTIGFHTSLLFVYFVLWKPKMKLGVVTLPLIQEAEANRRLAWSMQWVLSQPRLHSGEVPSKNKQIINFYATSIKDIYKYTQAGCHSQLIQCLVMWIHNYRSESILVVFSDSIAFLLSPGCFYWLIHCLTFFLSEFTYILHCFSHRTIQLLVPLIASYTKSTMLRNSNTHPPLQDGKDSSILQTEWFSTPKIFQVVIKKVRIWTPDTRNLSACKQTS